MKVVSMNMLRPSMLHVPRIRVKQGAYMSTLLDLACVEIHAKNKEECGFICTIWTVIQFGPEHWLGISQNHAMVEVGMDLWRLGHLVQPPCSSRDNQSRLPRTMSR